MTNIFEKIVNDLNLEQKDVVESEDNLYVNACPGSGKTRVLTRKIAYQAIKHDGSLKRIIAITYTNRAAEEIKERLSLLSIDDDINIWVGTIHQFCLEFIIYPFKMNLSRVQYTQVSEMYHTMLEKNKEIDFDMILLVAHKILTVNSNVARNIASNIRAIYVDEFQDTRELQYNVIAKLLQNNPQIQSMFVGDIDQAIYGSLDGIAKSVEELEMLTSHTFQSKTLHGCYRSNQRLVDFYSNFQSCPYEIESRGNNKNDRGFISYDCKVTKEDLPNIIKNIIKEKIESGIHEKDICVLAPQHYPLFSLGEYLKKELPYCNFDAINISPIKVNKQCEKNV